MTTDILEQLPSRQDISREIVATAQRARRLRSLYKLIVKLESEAKPAARSDDSRSATNG